MDSFTEPRELFTEKGYLTLEDIRLWAYDENLILMNQGEDVLLCDLEYVPLLLELMADESCPKRQDIFNVLCQLSRVCYLFPQQDGWLALEQNLDLAKDTQKAYVSEWANYMCLLQSYLAGTFFVDKKLALTMGQHIINGPGRIAPVRLTKRSMPEWWELSATTSFQEYLYINKKTGHFRHERSDPLTDAALRSLTK
jgi:hypothetical protein